MRNSGVGRPVLCVFGALLAMLAHPGSAQIAIEAARRPTQAYDLQWNATLSDDVADPVTGMSRHITDRSSTGTARLELQPTPAGSQNFIGPGTGSGHSNDVTSFGDGSVRLETQVSVTDGDSTNPGEFFVNFNTKKYFVTFPILEMSGVLRTVTPDGTTEQPLEHQALALQGTGEKDLPPNFNGVLHFSGTVPLTNDPNLCRTMDIDWTLTPVGPPPKLLLKQTNPSFVPEDNNTVPGVVVQQGSGGTPVPIRFILSEVTKEPGTCLNSPDQNTDPDLEFPLSNLGTFAPPVATGDGWTIETLIPATSATVQIHSKDWGAWGKLRAEAFYNGIWNAVPAEKSNQGFVTVPADQNNNKIADAWEKQNKLRNPAGGADTDKLPAGDKSAGDGFSVYEEYRGIIAKGQHRRLDPNKKELIIENMMGSDGDAGIAFFGSASGVGAIQVEGAELPEDRVVNKNTSGLFHNGDQHGLLLVGEVIGGGTAGEAVPANVVHKRPKDCTKVRIDKAVIQAADPANFAGELRATIAHELAHGVGVEHHGNPVNVTANRDILPSDSHYKVFDSDGKRISIPAEGFHLSGALGGPGSEASGDVNCVMCYTHVYQWCVIPPTGPDFEIFAAKPPVVGTRFCTSAVGTGYNAKGKYYGNASAGACMSQFHVKDY